MPSLRSLKKFFDIPSFQQIGKEREDEIIDKIVKTVSQHDMEVPALMVLSWLQPTSTIMAQTTLLYFAPMLELFGVKGYDYLAFFNKKENVKIVLDRLQELRDAKESGKDMETAKREWGKSQRNRDNSASSLFRRIRRKVKE